MQNIEESALSTCRQTIPLWLRYVDDTFTAVRHDEIDAFHDHLWRIILQPDITQSHNSQDSYATSPAVCNTTDSLSDENK